MPGEINDISHYIYSFITMQATLHVRGADKFWPMHDVSLDQQPRSADTRGRPSTVRVRVEVLDREALYSGTLKRIHHCEVSLSVSKAARARTVPALPTTFDVGKDPVLPDDSANTEEEKQRALGVIRWMAAQIQGRVFSKSSVALYQRMLLEILGIPLSWKEKEGGSKNRALHCRFL